MDPAIPRLSVILTGRNDGYGVDFLDRLVAATRFNVRCLDEAGIPFEYVLVEWAPPADRPLLSDLLLQAVPALGDRLTTYLVDPEYQAAMTQNARLAFLEFPAKNVGLRRATGEFLLSTNADTLLSRGVLESLRRGLQPGRLYRAPRVDLKLGLDRQGLTWELIESPRNHWRRQTLRPPLYSGGTGDFLLADRGTFHALRGFNEIFRLTRVAVDYNLLVKAYGCGIPIEPIDGCVYHLNHTGSFRTSRAMFDARPGDAPQGDRRWHSRHVSYENPDGWGLAAAPAEPLGPQRMRLRFDAAAAPPLLDLRRIVLPARRSAPR